MLHVQEDRAAFQSTAAAEEEEEEKEVVGNVTVRSKVRNVTAVTVRSTVLSATATTTTQKARSNVNGDATKRKNGIIAQRKREKKMMERMEEQNEKMVISECIHQQKPTIESVRRHLFARVRQSNIDGNVSQMANGPTRAAHTQVSSKDKN